jgi:dTDP-4-amino-4,6-dideoxygalactose transaminase
MAATSTPLLDLRRQHAALESELKEAFARVLSSGAYILGPETTAFEKESAEALGATHAIAVSSGTDALLLALMALNVGPGDEVICPSFSFFASAGVIARVGARPVFIDVDPVTYNCTVDHIAAAITPKTRAVMPVHLFGRIADIAPIVKLCADKKIACIEDAAQAFGAKENGVCAGASGTVGCYSFYPTKNLGTMGDAGLCVTNDAALAERMRVMRVHGGKPKYVHGVVGGNFRIDELHSAFLRIKLRHLASWIAARRAHAAYYRQRFAGLAKGAKLTLPTESAAGEHDYNQFVVRVAGGKTQRDAMRAFLADRKVGTEIYYPIPLHLQQCFARAGETPAPLPVSEAAADETLALPIFPEMTADERAWCADSVEAFFAK